MKKKRLHSCNVLDSSPVERHLWHFLVERDDVKLQREATALAKAPLPPKLVEKDWRDLYQPKLNIAWLPAGHVFLRVVQLPAADRQEFLSMLEFQLEKLSPLPVPQILWTAEVLPSSVEKMQTAIVCIVSRDIVEQFLGRIEEQNYQPDRLELPQLNQILADGRREDGAWLYPGLGSDSDLCAVTWWTAGVLQQIQLLRLPAPPAAEAGSPAPNAQAARAQFLHEELMETAWAAEMEGWLSLPVKWHLVADESTAAYWKPLLAEWVEDGIEVHPALDRAGIARHSANRSAHGEAAANLLPPEFAARYHQQYVDRLWMRALGAFVALYIVGVAIFLILLQVYSFQDGRAKSEVASIANTYTNVLRMKERAEVLQEQLNLKYAALDCAKVVSEQLPADFTLNNLIFSSRGLQVYGVAPADQQQQVIKYRDAVANATIKGQPLFTSVTLPTMNSRGGGPLNWNFECQLSSSAP